MTDPDVVQHFGSIYDLALMGPYHEKWPGSKPYYYVATSRRDLIFKIVADFYPYLGERRKDKCDEFLAWYQEKTHAIAG